MLAMASRSIVGSQETEMLQVNSYTRGYCVYKAVWEAICVDVLRLEREHKRIINEDRYVVAVLN